VTSAGLPRRKQGALRTLLRQSRLLLRLEAPYFVGSAKALLAVLAVALIPALYVVIYLSSVWDPGANSGALQVGLVNLDRGVVYREQTVNMGQELVAQLERSARFGYHRIEAADEARQQVRHGTLAFAIIIPPDFSSNAVPGAEPGAGKLVVYASEGNSFEGARIAQLFAAELGHKVNESLNEQRWSLVLLNAAGSKDSVERLRQAATQLHVAADELSSGTSKAAIGAKSLGSSAARLSDGVAQLGSGMHQMGAGLRTLDAKRPRNSELTALNTGAEALAAGHEELHQSLVNLQEGSQALNTGVLAFKQEADSSLLVRPAVRDNVTQLALGLYQLDSGLRSAGDGQQKLGEGATQLSAGVGTLTGGVRAMNGALRTMVGKLPEDSQIDGLTEGASELARASTTLAQANDKVSSASRALLDGTSLLVDALPAPLDAPQGSARGLANSVQPALEIEASVQNSGSGFAANIIPAALWLGAGIAAFLVNLRLLPTAARHFSPLARLVGKLTLPAAVVLLQAALVLVTVVYVLQIKVVQPAALAYTVVSAGLTFLLIVCALTQLLGDAGKALAMLFLAVQLSSSGGVLPVELSGTFFATMSPWLPITWVVHGLKASMFGAFDGVWQTSWHQVLLAGAAAALMATLVGRWRYVPRHALAPAIDL
jgi:putative membrane protein